MTGPGPHHNSPYGPQQQQPPPWQPMAGLPYMPNPPQRPSRTPLIIAAAIISAALIVGGAMIATWAPDRPPRPTAPAAAGQTVTTTQDTSTTTAAPTLVRVIPATVLPTVDQVRATTLMDVHFVGTPATSVHSDVITTPPECTIAAAAAGQSTWSTAISVAIQKFGDGPDEDHSVNFAGAGVGIFDTPAAAADSFTKVSDSVHHCTSYTRPDSSAKSGSRPWVEGDVQAKDNLLLWTDTDTSTTDQWKCAKAYRIYANLATFAVVCASNPGDAAARLTDQVITNVTKK